MNECTLHKYQVSLTWMSTPMLTWVCAKIELTNCAGANGLYHQYRDAAYKTSARSLINPADSTGLCAHLQVH